MAKGFPDYFGQSIWPKYGTMVADPLNVPVVGIANTVITQRTGQGVLTYFDAVIHSLVPLDTSEIHVDIDGQIFQEDAMESFHSWGHHVGSRLIVVARYASIATGYYILELSHDVPFHTSINIHLLTFIGENLTVNSRAEYYLV